MSSILKEILMRMNDGSKTYDKKEELNNGYIINETEVSYYEDNSNKKKPKKKFMMKKIFNKNGKKKTHKKVSFNQEAKDDYEEYLREPLTFVSDDTIKIIDDTSKETKPKKNTKKQNKKIRKNKKTNKIKDRTKTPKSKITKKIKNKKE